MKSTIFLYPSFCLSTTHKDYKLNMVVNLVCSLTTHAPDIVKSKSQQLIHSNWRMLNFFFCFNQPNTNEKIPFIFFCIEFIFFFPRVKLIIVSYFFIIEFHTFEPATVGGNSYKLHFTYHLNSLIMMKGVLHMYYWSL